MSFFVSSINYSLHLNGFRKNLAANLEQIPSKHSYGYAFSGICPIFFTIFSLNSVPFMKYAGRPP